MLSSTTLLGLAALLPGVLASYTGPTCGDTRAGTCPGKPFVGSTFTGLLCGLGDNTPQEAFADLTFQGPTALTECAQICATSSLFVLYQEFAGPGLTGSCYCASDIDYAVLLAAAVDCSGADVVATYFHPDAAAASGLARRKETSDAAKRRQIETNTFCPPGLTPCRIPGASEGYECLNTMTELESCGGCVAGLYSIPEAILTTQLDQRADRSPWLGPLPPYVYGTAITKRSDEIAGLDCTSEALRRGEQLTCKLGLCVGL